MKRNKRTTKNCQGDLSPLTERILTRMGREGAKIRRRLQIYYQWRQEPEEEVDWDPPLEN
jgi:hypothetical protein